MNITVARMIFTPVSGAVIGYFTNWLAIKMLFRPYKEVRLFGFKLPFTPGLIPKERYRLAEKVSDAISKHLLTKDALAGSFSSPEIEAKIREQIKQAFKALTDDEQTVAQLLDKNGYGDILDTVSKAISGYILSTPDGHSRSLKGLLETKSADLAEFICSLIENNASLDNALKGALGRVISNNLGTLASLFVNKDKTYASIRENLLTYLRNADNQTELIQQISAGLDKHTENISASVINRVSEMKIGELLKKLPEKDFDAAINAAAGFAGFLIRKGGPLAAVSVDISKITKDQINQLDLAMAEEIVLAVASRELNAITYFGGILGFIIGLLPVLLEFLPLRI